MTVRVGSKESREDGVGSRSREGKGRTTVAVATKRDNSRGSHGNNTKLLNHNSDFRGDSAIRLRALMKTLSMMTILNGIGQLAATCR